MQCALPVYQVEACTLDDAYQAPCQVIVGQVMSTADQSEQIMKLL